MIEFLIKAYMIASIVLGFYLVLRSSAFAQMSFWKKIVVLSISPVLISREVLNNFTRRRNHVKNSKKA